MQGNLAFIFASLLSGISICKGFSILLFQWQSCLLFNADTHLWELSHKVSTAGWGISASEVCVGRCKTDSWKRKGTLLVRRIMPREVWSHRLHLWLIDLPWLWLLPYNPSTHPSTTSLVHLGSDYYPSSLPRSYIPNFWPSGLPTAPPQELSPTIWLQSYRQVPKLAPLCSWGGRGYWTFILPPLAFVEREGSCFCANTEDIYSSPRVAGRGQALSILPDPPLTLLFIWVKD